MVENPPANAGGTGDTVSIPGSKRSFRGRKWKHAQYSFLVNSTDRGVWWATVHMVVKSWKRLSIQHCMMVNSRALKFCYLILKSGTTINLGFPVAQTVKCLPAMRETRVRFLGGEDPLEKEMAIHSSTFAWKIYSVHGIAKSET